MAAQNAPKQQKDFEVLIDDKQLIGLLDRDRKLAEDYWTDEMQDKIEEWSNIYHADEDYYAAMFPKLTEFSKFISTDVADTIEAIMPDLMKIFQGSREVATIQGKTSEDEQNAEVMQILCNHQINRLNSGFMLYDAWFRDALKDGIGVVKGSWEREYSYEDVEEVVGLQQLQIMSTDPNVEMSGYQPILDYVTDPVTMRPNYIQVYRVQYKRRIVKKNQPKFENVPISEFLFLPAKNPHECQCMIHKKTVTADHLRRQAEIGVYDNVEEAIQWNDKEEDETLQSLSGEQSDINISDTDFDDTPRKEITIYEVYTKIDVNDDGFLEDVIVTYAGDQVLKIQENTFGMFPFFILSGIMESYTIQGSGMAKNIGQIQNSKTLFIKQMQTNIGLANKTRKYVQEQAIYPEDLKADKEHVRVKQGYDPRSIVFPEPISQINPATFQYLDYMDQVKEQKSGINRFKQGLDHRVLNQAFGTATGAQIFNTNSNSRVELFARRFAETGLTDMYQFLISNNQRFITQEQVVRLTNRQLVIKPDDLNGEFDFVVSAGLGTGMHDQQMQMLNQILQQQMQVFMPQGLCGPEHILNTGIKMLEEMGYKDSSRYLKSKEQFMQEKQQTIQQQQIQQQMAQQQAMMQRQQQNIQPRQPMGPPPPTQGTPVNGGSPPRPPRPPMPGNMPPQVMR